MNFVRHIPAQPLAQFVELFWLYQRDALPHPKELALPTGTVELVFEVREGTVEPVICGPHSQPFVIETKPAALLGVHFKPGGAFPFLGLPAGELHNTQVSLDTIWGNKAAMVRDRLIEAKTPAAKFRRLEQALMAQATRGLVRHPAIAFALDTFHSDTDAWSVSDIVNETGFSPRRFIQLFRDEVGLTPKLYRRIHRFQQVLRRVHGSQRIDWTHVALDCGYFDQAHCIHDFREFSGLNPTAYLRVRGEHLNHVPLSD